MAVKDSILKTLFVLLLLCDILAVAKAQQQPLDVEAIRNWPEISGETISPDGSFVIYTIRTRASGANTEWYIKATDNSWARKIKTTAQPVITPCSRYVVFVKNADSIVVYDPVKDLNEVVLPGNNYHFTANKKALLLASLHGASKVLQLWDMNQKNTRRYQPVENFELGKGGRAMVIVMDSGSNRLLKWIELASNKESIIASSPNRFSNFAFDESNTQLAFTEEAGAGPAAQVRLRYFKTGMDTALIKAAEGMRGIENGCTLQSARPRFNKPGSKIFFTIKAKTTTEKDNNKADVNIWHYNDVYLPTEQAFQLTYPANFTAVTSTTSNQIIQISTKENNPVAVSLLEGEAENILVSGRSNYFSVDAGSTNTPTHYLINTTTGKRTLLIAQREITIALSPSGRFVTWYDPLKDLYFSYEIASGKQRIITPALKGLFLQATPSMRLASTQPYGIAGWLPGDSALYIYDRYDIWKVDPLGSQQPVNITMGYGRRYRTIMRIWNKTFADLEAAVIGKDETLLCAFNESSKQNGFFKINMKKPSVPVQLTMDDCLYYAHLRFNQQFLRTPGIYKAADAEMYLLRRMRVDAYPELYVTRDFNEFTALTSLKPEKHYNWVKAAPIHFTLADGRKASGILYKPTDFDSTKKYPVIFYIYEKLSQQLHQYIQPTFSNGLLNIPFLVSNGYLICTPDIEYKKGEPGESALQYVTAASKFISNLNYVDATRLGLQGHSFGGYQTNYIIAKSKLFAAAQTSAGASNLFSQYNGFYRESSAQFYFEKGQARMSGTMWQYPLQFQQNSPIFYAPQVSTPLLLMHSKDDGEIPFQQGLEWFTALKRLNKKVWLLQYDKESHTISQQKNQIDFTVRMKQFFDHYLKGTPAPLWMNNGLPVAVKGVEDRLGY